MIENENKLFEIQPEWCRKPLTERELIFPERVTNSKKDQLTRALFFDPTDLYLKIAPSLDPFKRNQRIGVDGMFPNPDGKCACGCGESLTGRQTRWAGESHMNEALWIYWIINGNLQPVRQLLNLYHGEICIHCKRTKNQIYEEDIRQLTGWNHLKTIDPLRVDHIFPVKLGGGACWLSNYQFLCHKCHVIKTNEDFGWKKSQPISQIELPFSNKI